MFVLLCRKYHGGGEDSGILLECAWVCWLDRWWWDRGPKAATSHNHSSVGLVRRSDRAPSYQRITIHLPASYHSMIYAAGMYDIVCLRTVGNCMVAICRLGVCHCCAADSWGLANRISPIHRITFPLCVWCPMANPHFIMVAMNVIISSETHSWIGSGIDSIACRWILPTVEARWTTNLRKGETLLKVWWNISK